MLWERLEARRVPPPTSRRFLPLLRFSQPLILLLSTGFGRRRKYPLKKIQENNEAGSPLPPVSSPSCERVPLAPIPFPLLPSFLRSRLPLVLLSACSEIMETVLSEAQESYSPSIVLELASTEQDEMETALDTVKEWVEAWQGKRKSGE